MERSEPGGGPCRGHFPSLDRQAAIRPFPEGEGSRRRIFHEMNLGVAFAPLVPDYVVWTALVVAILLTVLLVLVKARGIWMRAVAMALFVLAIANPSITSEERDPLTSVAVVIVDK